MLDGRTSYGGCNLPVCPLVLAPVATYDARMRWQGISSRLAVAALLSTVIGASTFVATASAQGSLSVTCVASSATQCVVTIDLVSNMDDNVIVTLPANNGFSLNTFTGTPDSAPSYTSLNDGFWSGTGTLWTCCLLQTGPSEPAGADSILTFAITPLTSSTTTAPKKQQNLAPLNLNFAAGSPALSASDKTQLQALAKKLTSGAKVTITSYARSNPSLARKRAIATTNYLQSKVKVSWSWTVFSISTRPLNRVTVTTKL